MTYYQSEIIKIFCRGRTKRVYISLLYLLHYLPQNIKISFIIYQIINDTLNAYIRT